MFNFFLIETLITALFSVTSWHGMSHWAWLPILGIGISSLIFQWFNTLTLTYGPARIMASFSYFSVVFSAIADYWLWRQTLSWLTLIGAFFVILGATLTAIIGHAKIE